MPQSPTCLASVLFFFMVMSANIEATEARAEPSPVLNNNILQCTSPHGYHIEEKSFTCPVDGEKFLGFQLGTHSKFGNYLDLKPISYMDFPIPVPVCPTSGFVMWKQKYTVQELTNIQAIVDTPAYKALYQEKHTSYYLFAKIAEKMEGNQFDEWWILLKSTWEAENCKHHDKYNRYAMETIHAIQKKLTETKPEDENFWSLNLVAGNLYRRIGDFSSARSWIKELPELPADNEYLLLAFDLLNKAIDNRHTAPVKITHENPPKENPTSKRD